MAVKFLVLCFMHSIIRLSLLNQALPARVYNTRGQGHGPEVHRSPFLHPSLLDVIPVIFQGSVYT